MKEYINMADHNHAFLIIQLALFGHGATKLLVSHLAVFQRL